MNISKELEPYFSSELSIRTYNHEQARLEAIEILENEMIKSPLSKLKFDDDKWTLWFNGSLTTRTINFEKMNLITNKFPSVNAKEFEIVVKCWLADLLLNYSNHYVDGMFRYFCKFLSVSEVFSQSKLEEAELYLLNKCSQRIQYDIAISTLNFLEFYDEFDGGAQYVPLLVELRNKNTIQYRDDFQRNLPPAKEVLTFNLIVNDYFSKVDKCSEEYIYYFPVYLWWNLTNIIPLRPFEFCSIARDALYEEKGEFLIKLPRKKNKKTKNGVQIIDEILISKKLGEDILDYIKKTNSYGKCKSLCHPYLRSTTEVKSQFSTLKQFYILQSFYKHIVAGKYKLSIKIDSKGIPIQCNENEINK